ncbi:MAG: tRNA (adenosine(37)-N6)-dimethylallyltransferase MiaA [Parcubacteria group bacterium]|nr:tRNA (adenosine(37)-N6)-dimethylallyltransferase MiaA [Parcubacteria group bacterium]
MKPKILVILGPTASGKSDLAVKLAKKFNGEIISADSRQVYKGLDIGTGKITKKEMLGIPHHLLDVANPKKRFTVVEFKRLADKAITDILKRGKLPIICGGTGFYIQAVVDNVVLPDVPPNDKLRVKLEKKTTDELVNILKKLDKKRLSTIDENNRRRLIRAIEIASALGKVPPIKKHSDFDALQIGTKIDDKELRERIHTRLIKRVKQGMITEAKNLHQNRLSWKRMEELGLEYRYLALYLQNKMSKDEMIQKLETEIWHYSRRQMTWFKKDKRIKWTDTNKYNDKTLGDILNQK